MGSAWHAFLHPLSANGASLYGGVLGDLGELPLVVGVWMLWRKHNCHQCGCWRIGHTDPEHGFPACRVHHSQAHKLNQP